MLLFSFGRAFTYACDYDACVGVDGFPSITAAIDSGRGHAGERWEVFIPAGEYRERILVDVPGVTLIGAGQGATVIHFDDYAGRPKPDGEGTWTTWGSATVIVRAADFSARDLSIQNRFDFLANDALAKADPAKIRDTQAVALMLDEGSDRVLLERVAVEGYQDTLFLQAGRALIMDSMISGNVDFIFGAGTALFVNSEIRMRPRASAHELAGYLTAASTDIAEPYGFVFLNCRLTREPGVADGSTSLGRPWHPTTSFADGRYADPDAIAAVVFINSWMDAHISSAGWSAMGGTAKAGGRIQFPPESARFFEFNSSGPGALQSPARRQLARDDAAAYWPFRVLGDWRPRVPLPLPVESAYSPQRELEKHRRQWPGVELVVASDNPAVASERAVVYTALDGRELRADVFLPAHRGAGAVPGIVLVHGGGWRSGSREFLNPLAAALAARGYVAATVDYRLSAEALYPAALEDIGSALRWLRANAGHYGLDPQRIALLGTSAGAHLASLVAVATAGEVQALVNVDGVVELVSPEVRRFEDDPGKPAAFALWIGGRYGDYPALWREASPLFRVGGKSPPTLFINSAQPRFHMGRDEFVRRLQGHGIAAEVQTIADTPHTFWLFHPWFAQTVEKISGFLDRVLAAPQSASR